MEQRKPQWLSDGHRLAENGGRDRLVTGRQGDNSNIARVIVVLRPFLPTEPIPPAMSSARPSLAGRCMMAVRCSRSRTPTASTPAPPHLVSFSGTDGASPRASLIADTAGNLFGTTEAGGVSSSTYCPTGCGTVYRSGKTNGVYASAPTVLVSFDLSNGTDGAHSRASLLADAVGNLFGTTIQGGVYGYGTVFEVTGSGYSPLRLSPERRGSRPARARAPRRWPEGAGVAFMALPLPSAMPTQDSCRTTFRPIADRQAGLPKPRSRREGRELPQPHDSSSALPARAAHRCDDEDRAHCRLDGQKTDSASATDTSPKPVLARPGGPSCRRGGRTGHGSPCGRSARAGAVDDARQPHHNPGKQCKGRLRPPGGKGTARRSGRSSPWRSTAARRPSGRTAHSRKAGSGRTSAC